MPGFFFASYNGRVSASNPPPDPPGPPKQTSLRGVGVTLLGLVMGAVGGVIAGFGFVFGYHPRGGGPGGDWTGLVVLIAAALVGTVAGLIAGIVWAVLRRRVWQLAAGLGGLSVAAGIVLYLSALD